MRTVLFFSDSASVKDSRSLDEIQSEPAVKLKYVDQELNGLSENERTTHKLSSTLGVKEEKEAPVQVSEFLNY